MITIKWDSDEDLEKVKKILVALEKNTDDIDAKAIKKGMTLKDRKALKKELKATAEKGEKV